MTTSFYAPPPSHQGDRITLPDDEARHAARVLRKKPGDEIAVVDGEGGWFRVRLDEVGKDAVAGVIVEGRREVGEPGYELVMGVALLKNASRFETFLEKAVELGVAAVVPLVTARTEKGRLKRPRAEGILTAAMKQSGRSRRVRLFEPTSLDVWFEEGRASGTDVHALICHEGVGVERSIYRALAGRPGAPRVEVLVGPEGGFSDEEVAAAMEAGFAPVSLGPRRLRTETAALTAAAAVMLAREKAPHDA